MMLLSSSADALILQNTIRPYADLMRCLLGPCVFQNISEEVFSSVSALLPTIFRVSNPLVVRTS